MIQKINSDEIKTTSGGSIEISTFDENFKPVCTVFPTSAHSANNLEKFFNNRGMSPQKKDEKFIMLSEDVNDFIEWNNKKLFKSKIIDNRKI